MRRKEVTKRGIDKSWSIGKDRSSHLFISQTIRFKKGYPQQFRIEIQLGKKFRVGLVKTTMLPKSYYRPFFRFKGDMYSIEMPRLNEIVRNDSAYWRARADDEFI